MTKVYYFSATGHSEAVARFFASELDVPLHRIGQEKPEEVTTAVVVFPVYCQNIPAPVKAFLRIVTARNLVLIATYGKMGYGNVLAEAAAMVRGRVIAGAYFPTGHTYLENDPWGDPSVLQPILQRIQNPKPVRIPHRRKWWLADMFPLLRSKIGVRMHTTTACTACALCSHVCPMGAADRGRPGKDCIRCLRCVASCPVHAINVSYHPFLRFFLRKPRQKDVVLYL